MVIQSAILAVLVGLQGLAVDPLVRCAEDNLATRVVEKIEDLPPEIQLDILRLTQGSIGERPRPLRRSHVLLPEERNYLNTRFYRALHFQQTRSWYVQIEHALMDGVHTLGYAQVNDGPYQRSIMREFAGPPCETIRAALAGVTSSVMYLGRSGRTE